MSCRRAGLGWLGVVVGAVAVAGCFGGGPPRVVPPSVSSTAGADAIAEFDTNKDGKLSRAELDAAPGLLAALRKVDTNNDGTITADEITARIKTWQDSKLGRSCVPIHFTRRGKDVADATVTLVPEKFLGSNMPSCTGKTDAHGIAMPSAPVNGPDDVAGCPPGFYRVQVTKAGENIPEKYNTKTTLGLEIALDSDGMESGYKFDLAY